MILLLLRISMTEQISGVVQVPRRCPVRKGAGTLAGVRSGAEIGLLSLRFSVAKGVSLGDFLLAPTCPIEKVTIWEGSLYLTLRSETGEGVVKDKVSAGTGNRTRYLGSKAQ